MSKSTVIAGLSIGVALGTAFGFYALAPNVEGGPAGKSSSVQQELRDAQDQAAIEGAQSNAANAILDQASGELVKDKLADTTVAIIATPDAAQPDVDSMKSLVKAAGGAVNASISLTDKALSTDGADTLKSLAAKSLPAGAKLSEDKLTPGMHTGQLLGAALSADTSDSDRAVAMGALGNDEFISYDGEVKDASLVIVITGGSAENDADGNYANTFTSDFTLGLDQSTDGAVLAGRPHSADKGGAVALVRDSREYVDNISTVDNVNAVSGRISVINELTQQKDNVSKHVGVGSNASAATA